MSEVIYVLTVVFFVYTIIKYFKCKQDIKQVTNCFDEGAEAFLNLIDSEKYDFH